MSPFPLFLLPFIHALFNVRGNEPSACLITILASRNKFAKTKHRFSAHFPFFPRTLQFLSNFRGIKKTFSLFFFSPFQVCPFLRWQQSLLVVGCWHSLEAFRNHSKFVKNEKTNFSAECILISYTPGERLLSFALLQHSHGHSSSSTRRSNSSSKIAEYIGWLSCVYVCECVC